MVAHLFDKIAPRYKNRPGGYTRITKIGARRGDAAPMVLLELVEGEDCRCSYSCLVAKGRVISSVATSPLLETYRRPYSVPEL